MNKRKSATIYALLCLAAICLLISLGQPLWKMRMEAPQYKDEEALKVAVFPNALRGDLNEIKTLNQYIGVHVPKELPQCKWLPMALAIGALLPLGAAFLRGKTRTVAFFAAPILLSLSLVFGAAQAQMQMHRIGHNRDQKTVLVGVKDFTPPLLGSTKIAQFNITSSFALGAGLIALGISLQLIAATLSRPVREKKEIKVNRVYARSQSTEEVLV